MPQFKPHVKNELINTTDLETHRGHVIPQFKPHVKNDQTLNDITDHQIKHPPRSKTTSRSPKISGNETMIGNQNSLR